MVKDREYTLTEIMSKYEKMNKDDKIHYLWGALSHMSHYNGHSEQHCIALAMGYDTNDGDIYIKMNE